MGVRGIRRLQRAVIVTVVLALTATGLPPLPDEAQAADDGQADASDTDERDGTESQPTIDAADPDDIETLPQGERTAEQAREAAAERGRPVAVESLRSERADVLANPDGTLTAELYAGAEHIRDAATGRWQRVDPTLVGAPGRLQPRVGAADVELSAGGGETLGTVSAPDGRASLEVGFAGADLPQPEVDGTVATYEGAFDGVDVELEALPAGFAKRMVVGERPGDEIVWRFPLELDGLEAVAADGGGVRLVDPEGREVAAMDSLWMWGAETDPDSGEPTQVAEVAAELVDDGDGPTLEVRLDEGFMADPDVEYPSRSIRVPR